MLGGRGDREWGRGRGERSLEEWFGAIERSLSAVNKLFGVTVCGYLH